MVDFRSTLSTKVNLSEIVRLYVIENWTLDEVMFEMEQRFSQSKSKLSKDGWKRFLNTQGIFKNFSEPELLFIRAKLRQTQDTWSCPVFADDVLQDNNKVRQNYERKRQQTSKNIAEAHRRITFFHLPFDLKNTMRDPKIFRNFRRLLFYVCVQFESSFDAGKWAPDERGLYARSDKLRTELTCLSNLHNLSVRALNQFKEGKEDMGWAMMQPVYQTQEKVVDIRHHRQIVDIFAIIRLFYKDNFGEICKKMINKFSELASPLADNDLRKLIFES